MSDESAVAAAVPGEPCKLITAVVPDDGTDLVMMKALRDEKDIISANSVSCLGIAVLREAKVKPGRLPEPVAVRMIEVAVPKSRADEIFDFIFAHAKLDRPGGGAVVQTPAAFCTPYVLPDGVPDEKK